MALPPLAPYPPSKVRRSIDSGDWSLYEECWKTLIQRYLELSPEDFALVISEHSLVGFLASYFSSISDGLYDGIDPIREACLLLFHKAFTDTVSLPNPLKQWSFLADVSISFPKSKFVHQLMQSVWDREHLDDDTQLNKNKARLQADLEGIEKASDASEVLDRASALTRVCYGYGRFLMTGSDLLDSLTLAFQKCKRPDIRHKVLILSYRCLTSLQQNVDPKTSTLIDHLYSLKDSALLQALVERTPLYQLLKVHFLKDNKYRGRARPLLDSMSRWQVPRRSIQSTKKTKGKQKETPAFQSQATSGVHVHKMSLITQIQDLFPDLGAGYVVKLLDEYKDNTEEVTAHLLDNSLPRHLQDADHSESFALADSNAGRAEDVLVPHGTPPETFASPHLLPTRNDFDKAGELDDPAIASARYHVPRNDQTQTADDLLSASERPSDHKAAILSALAAFDSDDDERDDTYDVEDVGGTVDTKYAGNDEADVEGRQNSKSNGQGDQVDNNEKDVALFQVYRTSPELFRRDAETRRGQARASLKRDLGMTDEALEGWAAMLVRDPRRRKRLEDAHRIGQQGGAQQPTLQATAWRGGGGEDDADSGSGSGGPPLAHRGRGRGFGGRGGQSGGGGRGGGGRGRGNVAGSSSDRDTQVARQRKDANKSSQANHNRRDQRAKKMARGGLAG